jgi:hypothetical protein
VQRAARTFLFALFVERGSDLERLGIDFDDGVDLGAGFVDLLDASEIFSASERDVAWPDCRAF